MNPGRLHPPASSRLTAEHADEDEFSTAAARRPPLLRAVSIGGNDAWFLNQLGDRFTGIYFSPDGTLPEEIAGIGMDKVPVATLAVTREEGGNSHVNDSQGLLHRYYDARPGTYYLVRPDQHVAGRWREFSREKVLRALARATGR